MNSFSKLDLEPLLNLSRDQIQLAVATVLGVVVSHRLAIIIYRLWFHPLSKFPGPPLLASTNFPLQYLANVSGTWFKTVKKAHEKYGPVVRIGPNHLALDGVVGWPQAYGIRKAGEKEFPKFPDYFEGGNANILSSDRESHRKLRKGMSGGFSEANLSEQALTIEHYIGLLVDLVTRRTKEGKDVDIVKMLNFTTFDIIGDLTYNDDFNSLQGDSDGGHHSWVLGLIEGVKGNAARRFGKFYPIFNPIVSWLWGSEIALTNEQNQMAGAKAFKRMEKGVIPPDGHKDFMTHMMKTAGGPAESALSPLEMMMNCSVIVMAGSETVATAMSGFFFYLHQNPRVYKILTKEIREAYKDESEIDMKNASALPYLHAVIEETMRVYPPAVEVSPRASPGAEVNGTWVPEGTGISVFQYSTFRNPDHFHDPNSFRPERWLPASHPLHDPVFNKDNKSVFKPFSHGTRDCIGKTLAWFQMHLIATRMLYRFDVEVAPGQDDWQSSQRVFIVWYKGPLKLTLKPRIAI